MSPSSRRRAVLHVRYPKRATASDLRRVYAWDRAGHDAGDCLDRRCGYDVLALINDVAAVLDLRTRGPFPDIEDLVHACPYAPRAEVRRWVIERSLRSH